MHTEIPPRLRWSCRRGMLELDVFLGKFLEEAYLNLPAADQELFVVLLESSDQDLFEWLTCKKTCSDAKMQLMVDKIREHARNRH